MKVKKKLRKWMKKLSKKSYRMKKLVDKTRERDHIRFYKKECMTQPTDDKLVLFECFFAKKYVDSPKAIYLEMLNNPAYSDYRFVWVFRREDLEEKRKLVENDRTSVVIYHTRECWKMYGKAKYWVLNTRVQDFIEKKPDQVFIQTWHGTPLKHLGFDITTGNNPKFTPEELGQRYLNNVRKADYWISPSRFATEAFTTAFGFDRLGMEDKLIETGYPRNDDLFRLTPEKIKALKKDMNLPQDKKIILYAPTWRDTQHDLKIGFTFDPVAVTEKLIESLPDDYIILMRLHYLIANEIDLTKFSGLAYDYSGYEDINDLYAVADVLMTDYSSVFFDYANLHRPMLFYMYDLEAYRTESHDFYFDLDVLPGPVLKTQEEVLDAIRHLPEIEEKYREKYEAFNKRFNYLDDENASLRVIQRCIG